jgi:hypothetical protein
MSDNPVPAIFFPIIDSFEILKTLVDEPDNASFESALNNEDISSYYIDGYAKFRHDARTGHHGKTAQLWVSYMDHIWLVLQLAFLRLKKNKTPQKEVFLKPLVFYDSALLCYSVFLSLHP